ncbi:glycoside hydrolase family 26 protein [Tepidibacter mesophilus]|uniref:glycoside hydrolase family 26 protein n=1 Tax=Tepidibacter mesophilus TaxID=655607 RepID=UPI000C06FC33|nr:glycosyl hydrolase [Tepidibacter mesophilus]
MNIRKILIVLFLFIISVLTIFNFARYKNYADEYVDYVDSNNLYTLKYPKRMHIDKSLQSIRTVIYDKNTKIEIYSDDFEDSISSPTSYINYSNQFAINKNHIIEIDKNLKINNMKVHLLKWRREKLSKIKNDKNYYVSAEFVKNENEVYTIIIKSSKKLKHHRNYMKIIASFKILDENNDLKTSESLKNKYLNQETMLFYEKYFSKNKGLKWGIFENTAPKSLDFLNSLEKKLDYNFKFLVTYQSFSSKSFPLDGMLNAYNDDRYVLLTLQTMYLDNKDNTSVMYDILNGKYDDFLNDYAKKIKEFNHPIMFRLNNEMNGDWCTYSSYYYSKDTDIFKNVYKYVYKIFEFNEVDNVLWVWNPHDVSFPDFKWNNCLNYYPGDKYVDIIGLTGYNAGTYYEGEKWRSFNEIYIPLYNEYIKNFDKPFMITEFGCNSVGGDKVKWMGEMFRNIKYFKNIKVAIWWNGIDWDSNMNPARIYRLDENEDTINAFREGLKNYK